MLFECIIHPPYACGHLMIDRKTKNSTEEGSETRRRFGQKLLTGCVGGGIAPLLCVSSLVADNALESDAGETVLSRLLAGNKRFVEGRSSHPHLTKGWRHRLVAGQNPIATIIGCSDSRVPPELLFDQGFGDLFVVRVAGTVIDEDVTGSVEYGVDHLATKLVMVIGHEGCGAVTAAFQSAASLQKEPGEIRGLVAKIQPSIVHADSLEESIHQSVEANVIASVRKLRMTKDLKKAEAEGRTVIVGCVYDLSTGLVRRVGNDGALSRKQPITQ